MCTTTFVLRVRVEKKTQVLAVADTENRISG
jgi:hypothetical protein